MTISRRDFLIGGIAAGSLGVSPKLSGLFKLPVVSAAETHVTPDIVQYTPEIEPFVRLIENTPKGKVIEVMAHQLRRGMTYQQFLGALFLAGIRNVSPQPPGFSFHCVYMIHSCNFLAKMGPPEERYLPLFLALDDFKRSQSFDSKRKDGDFVLRETIGTLPSGQQAWEELHAAMETWDEPRADRAITAIAREFDRDQIFEKLWEYGARDYRNIGHKVIFTAHAHRTLVEIGWEHAEPTLRSLILGLLDFGKDGVVNSYAFEDQGYLLNRQLASDSIDLLPGNWAELESNRSVTMEILDAMRDGQTEGASRLAVERLKVGDCKAGAVWDAVHLAAGELMMRQPDIIGVHTVTSSNAMRYAFGASKNPKTRLLLLLQGVAWMAQFRNLMPREKDRDVRITDLELTDLPQSEKQATDTILQTISSNRYRAAQQAYTYETRFESSQTLLQASRHLVFLKSREHHQIKWPAAIFEDYTLVSPEYRPHLLATSMYYLRGEGHPNSRVTERALEELAKG